MSCIFCDIPAAKLIAENSLAVAIYDKFPVNKGHVLIIPRRHFADFFDATSEEITAIYGLLHSTKTMLETELKADGFNVGINVGQAAGQTVMHLHVHLIPRFKGDVENPRGGVRKIKPNLVPYEE